MNNSDSEILKGFVDSLLKEDQSLFEDYETNPEQETLSKNFDSIVAKEIKKHETQTTQN